MTSWPVALLLLTSFSLNTIQMEHMVERDKDYKAQVISTNHKDYQDPSLTETKTLKVVGMKITGFDQVSLTKMQAAFAAMEKVVNSEEFKNRVINFKNDQGERSFKSNRGYSNEQIYDIFMDGRETLQPNTPNEMNFFLSLYNSRWSRVIGYTDPSINQININWKYFRNYLPNNVAGNLAHEWTHKIGFDHASAQEHDSAPYAIGYIVEELAAKYQATRQELH
jgi:hypothetical protein